MALPLVKGAVKKAGKLLRNKYVVMVLVILILIFLMKGTVKKWIRKFKARKFDKSEHKDVNQIAQQYRAASNPSGLDWMINYDGTDEPAIEKLAIETKGSLEEIAEAYRQKFDEALTDRLRKELDSDDYQSWRHIVT